MNAQELGLVPAHLPQVFEGDYATAMQKLTESGLPHWGPADVLRHRNAVVGTPFFDAAWDNYFFTDFGIAATADTVFLAPQSTLLHGITPKTGLESYGLPLGDDYKGVTTYARESMIVGRALTEAEALAHSGWLALTGNDQNLLAKTVENTFRLGKNKHGYDTMMGFYLPTDQKPIIRAAVLHGLDIRSYANGYGSLNNGNARLVGGSPSLVISSESAVGTAPKNALETVLIKYGMTDPAELRKALNLYRVVRENI